MQTLLIIDIGSHKLEELFVLLRPGKRQYYVFFKFFTKHFIKKLFSLNLKKSPSLSELLQSFKYFFVFKKKYKIKIISIEPNIEVALDYVNKLRKNYNVEYLPIAILGHDREKTSEIKKLFFYDNSISSSIYDRGRPIDESRSSLCAGLSFTKLWNELTHMKIVGNSDPFILRMNCEGAELGILEECKNLNIRPHCIIGSIGDVLKIHGDKYEKRMISLLKELNTPYYYFKGEIPDTWFPIIKVWKKLTKNYLRK